MGNAELKKPSLLIVEDDVDNQKFLEVYLQKYFVVDSCDSAETFYELINSKSYDLIMMDISIKGQKNGLELTKEIKNDPKFAEIPVFCFTAHAFNRDRINALNAGCDAYLSKPSDIRTLLNSLISLLKNKKKEFTFNIPSSNISFTNS